VAYAPTRAVFTVCTGEKVDRLYRGHRIHPKKGEDDVRNAVEEEAGREGRAFPIH
jgi:hypothetical protein